MKQIIITFCCLAIGFCGQTQEASFRLEVSNDSVLLGNYLTATFTLEQAQSEQFHAPQFDCFDILTGPNMARSTQISDGEMLRTTSYSYTLRPKNMGNCYIEPASIDTDQGVLESQPIEILVVANPEGIIQTPPQTQSNQFGFDMNDLLKGFQGFEGFEGFENFQGLEGFPGFGDFESMDLDSLLQHPLFQQMPSLDSLLKLQPMPQEQQGKKKKVYRI